MRLSDLLILGFILIAYLIYNIVKRHRQSAADTNLLSSRKAVIAAADLLTEQGYQILEAERRCPVEVSVDGRQYRHEVLIDLIVRQHGKTYLVEVKSGKQNRRVNSARSRRQLLEYCLVYDASDIILVDPDTGKTRIVSFDLGQKNWLGLVKVVLFVGVGALLTRFYYYFWG